MLELTTSMSGRTTRDVSSRPGFLSDGHAACERDGRGRGGDCARPGGRHHRSQGCLPRRAPRAAAGHGAGNRRGQCAGLAGSLETPDIPRLLMLPPDYLGFRGALCAGRDRSARLDPAAVGVVRGLIPADPRSAAQGNWAETKVDYRLLAARGYSIEPSKDDGATDRIFVRDLVLPVRIGAYAHERDKPQRVRFNVEVRVVRAGHAAEDMR